MLSSLIGGAVLIWAPAHRKNSAWQRHDLPDPGGTIILMPLAVYLKLESGDLPAALALSIVLVMASVAVYSSFDSRSTDGLVST